MKKLLLILFTLFISIGSLLQSTPITACTVKGTVKNASGETLPNVMVVCLSSNNTVIAGGVTDTEGKYSITVPPNTEFRVQYSAVGYIQTITGITLILEGDDAWVNIDVVLQQEPE